MNVSLTNSVAWFEVGTDDPEGAQRFYGELFGWTFGAGYGAMDYRAITTPGAEGASGGILNTKGGFPNYAVFYVLVEDVAATVAKAEQLGGKVLIPPTTDEDGLMFAHLHDSAGNHFGVFTPPPSGGS
ncbi:MAG: VOC family protein [Streptosporangiales bacterium]|nr:VOC family protein [Streptosporangiales bacterium]